MIRSLLLVAAGGAVGSACRYLIARMLETSFPWATFAVNILGSLLIGFLVGLAGRGVVSAEVRLLLVTGFCGGFTTFSTFANESFALMKAGDILLMAAYIAASVTIGVLAVWCGIKLAGA